MTQFSPGPYGLLQQAISKAVAKTDIERRHHVIQWKGPQYSRLGSLNLKTKNVRKVTLATRFDPDLWK